VLVSRASRLRGATARQLAGNVAARVIAMVVLAGCTLLVARSAGPVGVGQYAMFRVLTGLVGVVASIGLPTACTYFLAREHALARHLPATLTAVTLAAGAVGSLAWAVAARPLGAVFFDGVATRVVALAGVTVLTQLLVTVSRSCMQGRGDLSGSNAVFVIEEIGFLPAYAWFAGPGGTGTPTAIVLGLLVADVLGLGYGWFRLLLSGFLHAPAAPSLPLAREVAGYGARAQLGGVLALLNLRLDFVILGVLAGPQVVGIYGVASKYAETLRLPSMAITYVLYPRFAREGPRAAAGAVRRSLLPSLGAMTAGALALAGVAPFLLPFLYGAQFDAALLPALILVGGLVGDGVAGLITAYFYGAGRPGLNSWATGAGVVITVIFDIALIPRFGAVGAALASLLSYAAVVGFLLAAFHRVTRPAPTVAPLQAGEISPVAAASVVGRNRA
jgi:O-antigen/teichoic acid export membrane protein